MELTAEIARELLTYNPDTGKLFWKERPAKYFKNPKYVKNWNSRHAGKEGFIVHKKRDSGIFYKRGSIFSKHYYAHRIAWLIYYGEWPKKSIDHINHDRADNRIKNLRDVTHIENLKNCSLYSTNTTGYVGVHFNKSLKKYSASAVVNSIKKHLGYYNTAEEAATAREIANINYNFHPNHGNSKGI